MDFTTFIQNQMQKGLSISDIAKEMAKAMNDVSRKQEQDKAKQDYIRAIEKEFHNNYNKQCLTSCDATSLALLTALDNHKNWTVDQCKAYVIKVKKALADIASEVSKDHSKTASEVKTPFHSFTIDTTKLIDAKAIENFLKSL